MYGHARANWTETESHTTGTGDNRKTESRTVYYEGKDIYLNGRNYLFGYHGASSSEIAGGTHRYDFECQLPPQLPASFSSSLGEIVYTVEACLDIPWRFDREFKVQFTVVRIDDLNEFPELKMPCKHERIKKFCCFFCESKPLICTVTIPCGGFVPGESIPVTIRYDNKSDVEVDRTEICLKRTISYNRYKSS